MLTIRAALAGIACFQLRISLGFRTKHGANTNENETQPGYSPNYPPQVGGGYENNYPQNNYPPQVGGYPQNNYPQNNYPQNNYPQQGYPQQGYPQNNFPQNNYGSPMSGPGIYGPMVRCGKHSKNCHVCPAQSNERGQCKKDLKLCDFNGIGGEAMEAVTWPCGFETKFKTFNAPQWSTQWTPCGPPNSGCIICPLYSHDGGQCRRPQQCIHNGGEGQRMEQYDVCAQAGGGMPMNGFNPGYNNQPGYNQPGYNNGYNNQPGYNQPGYNNGYNNQPGYNPGYNGY